MKRSTYQNLRGDILFCSFGMHAAVKTLSLIHISENVLRVKAALRDFSRESNLSVITEDGAYYSFNVKRCV